MTNNVRCISKTYADSYNQRYARSTDGNHDGLVSVGIKFYSATNATGISQVKCVYVCHRYAHISDASLMISDLKPLRYHRRVSSIGANSAHKLVALYKLLAMPTIEIPEQLG